jgi:hypothetical protein
VLVTSGVETAAGEAAGVEEQASSPRAIAVARSEAAARARSRPRRSIMAEPKDSRGLFVAPGFDIRARS